MRQQRYSHPQLSSGYACRDKRWSGLIPSNNIESHHLLSSAAFGSAQGERPHLGRLKDTYTVTTSRCVSRALGREIKHFCVRQAQAMCLRLWKGLCDAGARESTEPCLPKERSPPHPTNTLTPRTGALVADTGWKCSLGQEWECSHKQETKENLLQKQNLW